MLQRGQRNKPVGPARLRTQGVEQYLQRRVENFGRFGLCCHGIDGFVLVEAYARPSAMAA